MCFLCCALQTSACALTKRVCRKKLCVLSVERTRNWKKKELGRLLHKRCYLKVWDSSNSSRSPKCADAWHSRCVAAAFPLKTLLMHGSLRGGCKFALRNSTARGTKDQSRALKLWGLCLRNWGAVPWWLRTILARMPPGFLLVATLWLPPSHSRSDEGRGAVRAFLNSLTGE